MQYDIFRICEGERAGLVDYLGQIVAGSMDSAEDQARLMFDWSPGRERIEVEEAKEQPCNRS